MYDESIFIVFALVVLCTCLCSVSLFTITCGILISFIYISEMLFICRHRYDFNFSLELLLHVMLFIHVYLLGFVSLILFLVPVGDRLTTSKEGKAIVQTIHIHSEGCTDDAS